MVEGFCTRILRGDENAWAEVARSSVGKDLPDIAAGALSRGQEMCGCRLWTSLKHLKLVTHRTVIGCLDASWDLVRSANSSEDGGGHSG